MAHIWFGTCNMLDLFQSDSPCERERERERECERHDTLSRTTPISSTYDERMSEAARHAAAQLPDADQPKDGVDRAALVLPLLVCVFMPIWIFGVMLGHPWGWAIDLAGLPAYLLARGLFFRLQGSETGLVTVDDSGVIRIRSGQLAIRRLQRLFDVGVHRWFGKVWVVGIAVGAGGPIMLGVLCVVLDSPLPAVVFLTGTGFALLDLLRFMVQQWWYRRSSESSKRERVLDGAALLPALALYAREHGWQRAVSGVPADELAATLAAHPREREIAQAYAAHSTYMSRLARSGT